MQLFAKVLENTNFDFPGHLTLSTLVSCIFRVRLNVVLRNAFDEFRELFLDGLVDAQIAQGYRRLSNYAFSFTGARLQVSSASAQAHSAS